MQYKGINLLLNTANAERRTFRLYPSKAGEKQESDP
jgi:hypothetical protein